MGFNSVYKTLKELFPQVDARILKAVAIEHAKDPDEAVESILTDVLPFIREKSDPDPVAPIVEHGRNMVEVQVPSSSILEPAAGEDANDSHLLNDAHNIDGDSLASSFYDANDIDDLQNGNTRNDDLVSLRCKESIDDFIQDFKEGETSVLSHNSLNERTDVHVRCENTIAEASQAEKVVASGSLIDESINDDRIQKFGDYELEAFVLSRDYEDKRPDVHVEKNDEASSSKIDTESSEADVSLNNNWDVNHNDVNDAPEFDYQQKQQSLGCNLLGLNISADPGSISVTEPEAENVMAISDVDNKHMSSYADADFSQDFSLADVGAEDESHEITLSTIVTHSGQICRINLVEDIIKDAKNYKDVLLSATESILRLIEDVEHQEKEAEKAKAAAARGGLDILEKVEEIKKMLKHAKEANEMHAGEVYGEKSILATEVRELQTRLLGLADDKDKSLIILDETRETLEARLAASEEERKAAETEMLEKQEIAKGALAEQELVMERVVQESKLLQQEAEENAKLRDFLMEKGRVVDELQGEISVICQDVKSLKEKFDQRVSLSKYLSIEQTSFRMASSTSSVKSMASDPATGHMELPETPNKMSRAPSVECQTPKSNVGEEAVGSGATPVKELLDEDWELFDF
ncbi:CAP-Gly domain-containing linker protein 1-like [Chenopodium quinoa]|uniref:CUE domain-containing protein n=1 Tax=Chenopodium quinoa TaxID=63459 RepID=A0A803MR07_CHEQI|nr:CAP-Gly domain-containing linker protein 1-like [Chenopodium quinoa]XP_021747580.1 CAP-Gly domain-containing linker protein 1-like [Chenopodium quinoa]